MSRRNWRIILSVVTIAIASATTGRADVVLSPGSTWKYVNTDSAHLFGGSTAGFETTGYDDSGWFSGAAPFSNVGSGDFAANTNWDAGFDPLVRTHFSLASVGDGTASIGVDNGYTLYINGNLISSDNAEGFTFRWEYVIPISSGNFVVGDNVIALALEDHGGLTAFDMQLDVKLSAVPEPTTLATSGTALLLGLAAAYRRRRRTAA